MRASQIVRAQRVRLVDAAPLRELGDSPEMDGGIEQNPAYGTARPLGIGDAVQSAMYDPAKPPLKRRDGPQKEFLRPSAAIYARSC